MHRITSPALLLAAIAVLAMAPCHAATAQSANDDGLPEVAPANTTATTPRSPYDDPTMALREMEEATRNSAASQEVNKNLNEEFGTYDPKKK